MHLVLAIHRHGESSFRGGITFSGRLERGKSFSIQADRIFNRMRISISVAAVIALVAMTVPRGARAQVDDQFSWGVSAGAAVPMNYLAKDHNTGVNAGITMAFGGVGQLFGIRADGMFNQFGAKSGTAAGNARGFWEERSVLSCPCSGMPTTCI